MGHATYLFWASVPFICKMDITCVLPRIVMRTVSARFKSTLLSSTGTIVMLLDNICQEWEMTWFIYSPVPDKSIQIQWGFFFFLAVFRVLIASGAHWSPGAFTDFPELISPSYPLGIETVYFFKYTSNEHFSYDKCFKSDNFKKWENNCDLTE